MAERRKLPLTHQAMFADLTGTTQDAYGFEARPGRAPAATAQAPSLFPRKP